MTMWCIRTVTVPFSFFKCHVVWLATLRFLVNFAWLFQPSRGCWWAVELWTRHQYCRGQSVTALAIMSLIYEGIAAGKYKYPVFTASLIDIVLSHLHCFPYWYRISHNRSIQNCRIHDFLKHSFSKIKYVSLWIQSVRKVYSYIRLVLSKVIH